MKIAVVTCYYQPDYVRAVTLRHAVADNPKHQLLMIKNNHKGLLRYPEVLCRLIWVRLTKRPDAYLLTFRAYEIFPFANILTWPKPLIYDEFLNPLEWLEEDRKEWWAKLVPKALLRSFYNLLLKRPVIVLADTDAHANYSQKILGLRSDKFVGLPVGTDESLFHPVKPVTQNGDFTVFYYGSMIPLHGLSVVLEAFERLKDLPIKLVFSGGDQATVNAVEAAKKRGAHIEHLLWIPYAELRDYVAKAQLTLGGPFGDTTQAKMVVTGKTYQFLACNAPVLVGETEVKTNFKDGVNCLSVPLGDAQALADKIEWAYNNPGKLETIRKAGRKLYEDEFSPASLSRQLGKILERL